MKKVLYLIIIAVALVSCKTNTSQTSIEEIEELVMLEKYREATTECEKILYADTSEYNQQKRFIAADYLRLCLLKTGSLNSSFYNYKKEIREMFFPIPQNFNLPATYFTFECAIPIVSEDINVLLEENKEKPVFWNLFEKNSVIINEKRYFETIITLLRPEVSRQTDKNIKKIIRERQQKTTAVPQEAIVAIPGVYNISQSCINLFPIYQNNREILEVYTAQMLFSGQLDSLPQIVKRYSSLGYTRLPDYVQEAVIISQQSTETSFYYGFEIEWNIKKRCEDFLRALNNLKVGIENFEAINKEFGGSYIFYYFVTER